MTDIEDALVAEGKYKQGLPEADTIQRLIAERDEALEALRNLMRWVNPIAGDNHDEDEAEKELSTTIHANAILSKYEAKP